MQDIKLTQDENGRFDISVEDGDIAGVEGMDTSLYVSLFTDARAPENLVIRPEHRRGWPGNLANNVQGRQLGSLLWLVDQSRLTQDTLNKSIDYARKGLAWYVEDGVLLEVIVDGIIVPRFGIQLEITTVALNGSTETQYFKLWEVTGAN